MNNVCNHDQSFNFDLFFIKCDENNDNSVERFNNDY